MAKAKQQRSSKKKGNRRPRRKAAPRDTVHHVYARALNDPCQGPLVSVYPGEKGQIGRFVLDTSYTIGGTDTAYIGGFWPALNGAFNQSAANGATVVAPSWSVGTASSVGYSTFVALYQKTRCISACVEITLPSVSALNIVGEITTACLAAGTFQPSPGGAQSLTPNDVFTLSPTKYMLQRKVYEQKFSPGQLDSRYNAACDSTQVDGTDTNALFYAIRGVPAGTTITVKWTAVYEGTARRLGGMATSATNMRAGSHDTATNVAAALHSQHPGWAASAKDAFGGFLRNTAAGFASFAGQRAGRSLGKALLTEGSAWSTPIIEEMAEEATPLLLTL
jgi:hypothetical protein